MQLYYKGEHAVNGSDTHFFEDSFTARATFWLWELRDLVAIGISLLLSVLALTQTGLMLPLIATALFAFLSIRFDGVCILDFIKYASAFLLFKPQLYEWRPRYEE